MIHNLIGTSNRAIIQARRDYLKKSVGIKLPLDVPEITGYGTKHYDIESSELRPMRRYPYANQFSVVNSSSAKINIILDYGTRIYPIPANSLITFDRIQYSSISVENTTADAITANNIVLMAIYEPEESKEISLIKGGMV